MATKIKVETVPMPNQESTVAEMEQNIENIIKQKLSNGWTFLNVVGGDNFILLIFSKQE